MSEQPKNRVIRVDDVLEWTVVWVVVASALGVASTLIGHFMAAQICVATTLLTALYGYRRQREPISGHPPKWAHIALLLLISLFFRLPAFNFVLGGQDEGLYVNMAQHIEQTGGLAVRDAALDNLQGGPFVERYLAENRDVYADDEGGKVGDFVLGFHVRSPGSSDLDFRFYPLFPVWMAIFSGIFGSAFGVYALTLFALLSVIFIYRLTLVLTNSPRAALWAGLLLALNPLHAFFSKFPVTEVPALALSLIGFTYLAMFWNAEPKARYARWLILSALGFGAMFVTRISGFMYVPFFIAMALAGSLADPDRSRQRLINGWVLATVALFALSVIYGLQWTHRYAVEIYRAAFEGAFHRHWRIGAAAVAVLILLLWPIIAFMGRQRDGLLPGEFLVTLGRRAIGPIVIIGLILGIYKIYQLGWTTHFRGDAVLDTRWGLAGHQWLAVRASSLATLFVYLGPLLPLAFLGLVVRRKNDPRVEFLRLFTAGFFVYVVLLQWILPYGPYYARYLLSEMVPYGLLFIVFTWELMPQGNWRRTLTAVMAITLIYGGVASAAQLGKRENAGLYDSLSKLLAPVDSGDVILLDDDVKEGINISEIKTPMMFTFNRSVVTVSAADLANPSYIAALNLRYGEVFLVSLSAETPQGFASEGSTPINVWAFVWTHFYPRSVSVRESTILHLYRLVRPTFPLDDLQSFKAPGAWNEWLVDGWGALESNGVWSIGAHAEIDIDPQQLPRIAQGIRLNFGIHALVTPAHPQQRVLVSVNDLPAGDKTVVYPDADAQIDVKIPVATLSAGQKIRLRFDLPDAVTPNSIGLGGDPRLLAIMLETMTASALEQGPQLSPPPSEHPSSRIKPSVRH
jgi:hypothetical protein